MNRAARLLAIVVLLALAACGKPSKEELVRKSENVKTKAELQAVLGLADDINKVGPIETWRYKGSNGDVVFIITGNIVQLQATDSGKNK
ncbi:MAG: hypothetical protein ABI439_03125 [Rhodospirillales bacterium]